MKHVLIHNYLRQLAFFVVGFFVFSTAFAQSIGRPSTSFTDRICTRFDFNEFDVTANYTGDFPTNTTFTLVLSDPDGNFDSNTFDIATIPNAGTGTIDFLGFSFPESIAGESYRFKIVPSVGSDSQFSNRFPAYYFDGTQYKLDSCIQLGNTLFADPADLDSYEWFFREIGSTIWTSIEGAVSSSYTPTQVGEYHFKEAFGSCAQSPRYTFFNFATVVSDSDRAISITGPSSYSECSDQSITLNSSQTDPSFQYKWLKDGVELSDSNDPDFIVSGSDSPTMTVSGINMDGQYIVQFSEGLSTDEIECANQSEPIMITLRNPKVQIISPESVFLLPPGEPKLLEAELLRGTNPTYTWYRNDQAIPDSNSLTLEVTEGGVYYIQVDASSECATDNITRSDESVTVASPENIVITTAYVGDYDNCVSESVTLEVTSITATLNGSTVTLEDQDLEGLVIDWRRDGVSTGETAIQLNIDSASNNGSYTAVIESNAVAYASDPPLEVVLDLGSFDIIKTPETLTDEDAEVVLSLGLENDNGYSFQWARNNESIPGATNSEYAATEPGLYSVSVTSNLCGPGPTITTTLSTGAAVIPNVVTPDGDGINDNWQLPSQFLNQQNVEINIYSSGGQLDFSGNNYNGNWPSESQSNAVGTIYYYIISRDNNPVEQGSITIIR